MKSVGMCRRLFYTFKKVQGAGRIAGSFFKKGNKSLYRIFNLLSGRGEESIIYLDCQNDQYDFGESGRVVKVNFSTLNALTDDFCQIRLQLRDQMMQVLLMKKRTLALIQRGNLAVLGQKVSRGIPASLKDLGHPGEGEMSFCCASW